jgi:hypothetical protein
MKRIIVMLFAGLFFLSGCWEDQEDIVLLPGKVVGLRPVYSENYQDIQSLPPQPIDRLGKIYYKDKHIYVTESNFGIHVINNTNPESPQPIRFLQIPGCRDIAIKGNILYTDNVTDLVAIDISNLDNVEVVDRLSGLYSLEDQNSPEFYEGYFECVNPERGMVIGWVTDTLLNPQCFQ